MWLPLVLSRVRGGVQYPAVLVLCGQVRADPCLGKCLAGSSAKCTAGLHNGAIERPERHRQRLVAHPTTGVGRVRLNGLVTGTRHITSNGFNRQTRGPCVVQGCG